MLIDDSIEIACGKVGYLRSENFDDFKPIILALHGWLDNAASFTRLEEHLPDYNWIALDLPGHGKSCHRGVGSHYHFIDWITDIRDFMEVVSLTAPIHLVGHSLGGMLATVVAGLYPERVKKLVLIDSAGLITQQTDNAVTAMRKALDSRVLVRKKSPPVHPTLDSAINARAAAGDLLRDAAEILVRRNIEQTKRGYEWRTDQRLRTQSPVRLSDDIARQIINSIQSPVLICLAKDGYPELKQNFHKFAPDYLNLSCVEVSGGHHCHLSHPNELADAIRAFI